LGYNTATVSVSPTSTTTYSVTVTDKNGCISAPASTIVTVNSAPTFTNVTTTGVTCYGGNNGSIKLGAQGGSGIYTYSENGTTYQTSNVFNNLVGGYNQIYVKDAGGNGCTSNSLFYIYQPTKLTTGTYISSATVCTGGSSTITANPSGGTGPYSYSWSTGATTSSITVSPTATTTYSVTVTDACSATATASTTITYSTAVVSTPTITASGTTTFCGGKGVTLSANDATSGVTYLWYKNGASLNAYGSSYYASAAGSYTVQAYTSPGCVANSVPTAITILPTPAPTIVKSITYNSCSTNTAVLSIQDTSTATNLSYQWGTFDSPTSLDFSGATNSTYTTTTSAWYTVTVKNNTSGCSTTSLWDTVNFTPSPSAFASSSSTNDVTICPGGSATLNGSGGGNGSLTYLWSPSAGLNSSTVTSPVATPTTTTTYTLTVTDAHGCSHTSSPVTIHVNPVQPTITISGPKAICSAGSSVALSISNKSYGVTYRWYNNGSIIGGATSNTYNATTTGQYTAIALACSIIDTSAPVTVATGSNPGLPTITRSPNNPICPGDSATLTAHDTSTNISYQWINWLGAQNISGATNAAYTTTKAGTYYVRATYNTTGCSTTSSYDTIHAATAPTAPTITASSPTIPCSGGPDTLTASTISGVTYQWYKGSSLIAGATNTKYIASAAGTYSVTVTNTGGCTASASQTITGTGGGVTVSITTSKTTICLGDKDTLTANPSGGASPYTYNWSTGDVTSSIAVSPVNTTIYSVTVTDANGCTSATASDTILIAPIPPLAPLIINASSPTMPCSGGDTLMTYDSGGATYQWYTTSGAISGATNSKYVTSSAGTFSLVKNIQFAGCPYSLNAVLRITQPVPIVFNVTRSNDTLFASAITGGISPYTYNWLYKSQSVSSDSFLVLTNNTAADYTATVTDANSCSDTTSYAVGFDTINGQITNPTASAGEVYLLTLNKSDSTLSVIDSAIVAADGTFEMVSIYSPVYIYYVPDTVLYPFHVLTYFDYSSGAAIFNDAHPINLTPNTTVSFAGIIGSDSGATGVISGQVTVSASNGRVLSNAAANLKLVLIDSVGNPVQTVTTNSSGMFNFSGLKPGNYTVMADIPSFLNFNPPVINLSTNINQTNLQLELTSTSLELVQEVTAVNQPTSSTNSISLYPNPAHDIVYITGSQSVSFAYSLCDMSGREIKSGTTNSTIDVAGVETGVYLVKIVANGAVSYNKVVIE